MRYTPPPTITVHILNLVADISQQVGRLVNGVINVTPQQRKQNHNKTIAGAMVIEGSSLTEAQNTATVAPLMANPMLQA